MLVKVGTGLNEKANQRSWGTCMFTYIIEYHAKELHNGMDQIQILNSIYLPGK